MNNETDIILLLSNLSAFVRTLAKETANLIDDRADRSERNAVNGIRARASEIRASADALGELAQKVLRKTG
jgi:hypothetical protein